MAEEKKLRTCRRAAALLLALALALPGAALAAGSDPAAEPVNNLYDALLATMKQAQALGVKGRYQKLAPVLGKTYDIGSMSRTAVGQRWDALPPAQKTGIIAAFTRMTTATYASRFDNYSGESFEILGVTDQPNGDKIVKTRIVQSDGKAVPLNYLVRKSGADWKVEDVYLNGTISELANRRAEFGSILSSGGAPALINSLTAQGDKLLAGG